MAQPFLEKTNGCIVNLSCEWGSTPQMGMISYCMSKAGLEMMTKCLALELAPIRINSVAPTVTRTNMFRYANLQESEIHKIYKTAESRNPMKRIGVPDDVVKAVMFLCSKRASNITGQIIKVDGGHSLTSATFTHWDSTITMNSKFLPTAIKPATQLSNWVS